MNFSLGLCLVFAVAATIASKSASTSVNSVVFRRGRQSIIAPGKFCYSGRKETERRCPDESNYGPGSVAFPATALGEGEFVTLEIKDLLLSGEGGDRRDGGGGENPSRRNAANSSVAVAGSNSTSPPLPLMRRFKAQFYLAPVSSFATPNSFRCCWDQTQTSCDAKPSSPPKPLPRECSPDCGVGIGITHDGLTPFGGGMSGALLSASKDYLEIDLTLDEGGKWPSLTFDLFPSHGQNDYIVLVSNCADTANSTSYLKMEDLVIRWNFFGGSLRHMLGLIPFYIFCTAVYAALSALWILRSKQFQGQLLGLQKALSFLVYAQAAFSLIASAYYIRLNNSADVDYNVLYAHTFAAMEHWDFWTLLLTSTRLATVFACQTVVTLAADGKWLIQHAMNPGTRRFLILLAFLWIAYFAMYPLASAEFLRFWAVSSGIAWIAWLLFSVRRALRTLRSLTLGDSSDNVSVAHPGGAGGSMLTAKRGLFQKMCCLVAAYPVVFTATVILDANAGKANLGAPWIGYVLTDVYILLILTHTSYLWVPRAAVDYGAYAPVGENDGGTLDGDFEMEPR